MKWLLILFSLYVIVLSGVPCDCQEGDLTCMTDAPADDCSHHTGEHQKQDCPCSPFFACSTAPGIIVPDSCYISISKPLYAEKQTFYSYQEMIVSRHPFSVFQPPRVA